MEKTFKHPNFSPKPEMNIRFTPTADDICFGFSRLGKDLVKNDSKIGAKRQYPDVDANARNTRAFNGGSQPDSNNGLSSPGLFSPKSPIDVGLKSNTQVEENKEARVTDDTGGASANAKVMEVQNPNVRVLICSGGEWELVNGVLEYMPIELMRRMLSLPSDLTYSKLMSRVAKKLNLNSRSGFKLSYKIPPSSCFHNNNEVIEIGDDEEVSALIDVAVRMPQGMVTLCVVESEGSSGDYSSSGSNHGGNAAPVIVNDGKKKENVGVEVKKDVLTPVVGYPHVAEADKGVFQGTPPPRPPPTPETRLFNVCYEPSPSRLWLGYMFINKEVLKQALELKCKEQGFEFRTTTWTYERFEAGCSKLVCKWHFRATIVKASEYRGNEVFKIRIYNNYHTCSNANESRPQKDAKKEDSGAGMPIVYLI